MARLVLDESQKPLSLRRVPPNLICGDGASDFAFTHGVSLLPNDVITSASARERWAKWKKDLENVRETPEETVMSSTVHIADPTTGVERPVNVNSRELAGLSIDSQPISPRPNVQKDPLLTLRTPSHTPDAAHRSTAVPSGRSGLPRLSYSYQPARDTMKSPPRSPLPHGHPMGDFHQSLSDEDPTPHVDPNPQELFRRFRGQVDSQAIASIEEDMVTDTVGAIAIDCYGNIAAASSSGGIGMKHRGRIGPAALVGIGTSVIPAPVGDLSKTVVATVTSGTGEHMATTNAAHMCAYALSRNSTYWENKGHFIDESDDEIIKNFIDNDFMGKSMV